MVSGHKFDGTLQFSYQKFKKKNVACSTFGECSNYILIIATGFAPSLTTTEDCPIDIALTKTETALVPALYKTCSDVPKVGLITNIDGRTTIYVY